MKALRDRRKFLGGLAAASAVAIAFLAVAPGARFRHPDPPSSPQAGASPSAAPTLATLPTDARRRLEPPPAPAARPPGCEWDLAGHVVDPWERPVTRGRVEVRREDARGVAGASSIPLDATGGFHVHGESGSGETVILRYLDAEGHGTLWRRLKVPCGGSLSDVVLCAHPGARLTVRVLDPHGLPLSGALVTEWSESPSAPRAVTDADGVARLSLASGRKVVLCAMLGELRGLSTWIDPPEGEASVEIRARRWARTRVHLSSGSGSGLSGRKAKVMCAGAWIRRWVTCEVNGPPAEVWLPVKDDTSCAVHVDGVGARSFDLSVPDVEGSAVDLHLPLVRPASVNLRCLDARGEGIAGLTVSIEEDDTDATGRPRARASTTDDGGRLRFEWLEPGTYEVVVGRIREQVDVQGDVEHTIRVPSVTRVGGVILGSGGAPVEGSAGLLVTARLREAEASARVGEGGRWALAVPEEADGPVSIELLPCGGAPPKTLVRAGDTDHRWHVPLVETRVRVRWSGRTRCLGTVALRHEDGGLEVGRPIDPASGFATFHALTPGRYLATYRPGTGAATRPGRAVEVRADAGPGPQQADVDVD